MDSSSVHFNRELAKHLCMNVFKQIHAHPDVSHPVTLTLDVAKMREWYASLPPSIVSSLVQDESLLESAMGYENFCMDVVLGRIAVCGTPCGAWKTVTMRSL